MELLKRIQELLKKKDVTATFDGDNDLTFVARAGPMSVRIFIRVTESAVAVRAFFPLYVPANRRDAMCVAISLVNFELRLSRVEMDASDGEIRCRAEMPLYDGVPTDQQLTRLIYSVWSVSEKYAPALIEIMTTLDDPAYAVARVEAGITEPTQGTAVPDLSVN